MLNMPVGMKHLALFLLSLPMAAIGQDLDYLNPPEEAWARREVFPPIGEGNGVYMSPDGDMVVAIASTCFLKAFSPSDGATKWQYPTPLLPSASDLTCKGGITFSYNSTKYLTYMAIDTVGGVDTTRIIALDTEGIPLYQSTGLSGEGAGSPQTTLDGRHIVATHNDNVTGYFSVIDTNLAGADPLALSPIFTDSNSAFPFGPVGVFHNPVRGNYASDNDNGVNNQNDLFLWGHGVVPPVQASDGQHYVFQFPVGYNNDGSGLEMIPIGNTRSWQSSTRPIISNGGLSMWWTQAKGDFRCWADAAFSGVFTTFVPMGRGNPAYIGARAPPTLSSDPNQPTVYGAAARAEFFRANFDCSEYLNITVESVISAEAIVSPDDDYVYFATQNGILYQVSGDDLTEVWNIGDDLSTIPLAPIYGDIAMSPDGTKIFVGERTNDIEGAIVAITVARNTAPTASPVLTDPPTLMPTPEKVDLPSDMPSSVPSETLMPTQKTVDLPSDMPSSVPSETLMPTQETVDVRSDMPSSVPSESSGPTFEGQADAPTSMPVVSTEVPTADPGLDAGSPTSSPVGGAGDTSGSMEASSFIVLVLAAIAGFLF